MTDVPCLPPGVPTARALERKIVGNLPRVASHLSHVESPCACRLLRQDARQLETVQRRVVSSTDRPGARQSTRTNGAITYVTARLDDVVANELELRIIPEVLDVALRAGEEIVEAQNLVPVVEQPVAQVRSDETGATGN